ncbi:hypothetical protein ACFQRK_17300 [Parapedobacter sp. GCM10030251]|uniref:hypothetical protein n=1 Tax=Parapedobacter sp. GCM10030251 TaxID=3273419 RepID=UPI0036178779
MNYLRPYLEHFRAEDIVGIEVMSGMQYKSRYQSRYLSMKENVAAQGIGPCGLVFIEITTRLGTGPFLVSLSSVQCGMKIKIYLQM